MSELEDLRAEVARLRVRGVSLEADLKQANLWSWELKDRAEAAEAGSERLRLILEGGESAEGAMRAVREVVAMAGRAEAAEAKVAAVEALLDEWAKGFREEDDVIADLRTALASVGWAEPKPDLPHIV